ncbi:hypothetical protein B0T26DRAFT_302971 [Lasiosphaeria miniovina]|uniref:Uncharacterized protein n=1 Tax=Lasiosphaeria miniovina TaxID=1954250 RepID=A0AA40AKW8_9PEZI|nr:uncharacterized protein B0T26DRAFT_302971 [Lasiosphaeria miniovina]KAK0717730.1 hypothetical protein B0T26DRAFT_302971 [Lasiosphaeria miniovina]
MQVKGTRERQEARGSEAKRGVCGDDVCFYIKGVVGCWRWKRHNTGVGCECAEKRGRDALRTGKLENFSVVWPWGRRSDVECWAGLPCMRQQELVTSGLQNCRFETDKFFVIFRGQAKLPATSSHGFSGRRRPTKVTKKKVGLCQPTRVRTVGRRACEQATKILMGLQIGFDLVR